MKIYGNIGALSRLSDFARQNKLPHSILFSGDEGTGKKLLADHAAMLFFCSKDGAPCGKCLSCEKTREHIHPDVIYVDCRSVGAEEMRNILRSSHTAPIEEKLKIFIMTEFQLLNRECQNAMLTYLEEPSDRVRFILTSSEKSGIIPTVMSRVSEIRSEPPSVSECAAALEERGFDREESVRLAGLCRGNIGAALKTAENKNKALCAKAASEFVTALCEEKEYKALSAVNSLPSSDNDKRAPMKEFVFRAGTIFHDAVILANGGKSFSGNDSGAAELLKNRFSLLTLSEFETAAQDFTDKTANVYFNPKMTASAFTAEIFAAAKKEKDQ